MPLELVQVPYVLSVTTLLQSVEASGVAVKFIFSGPERGGRAKNDDILWIFRVLHQVAHIEICDNKAEKIHAVIKRRGQHYFRSKRAGLHTARSAAAVLLPV